MLKKILNFFWRGGIEEIKPIQMSDDDFSKRKVTESEEYQEIFDVIKDRIEQPKHIEQERIKPIEFKINETEIGCLSVNVLQIDGASYVEGMNDYEWIFQIENKDFATLLKLLKETDVLSKDVPTELMNYLKENGTQVSAIIEICKDNDIEYFFQNRM